MYAIAVFTMGFLVLYACGKIEAPQTDREAQAQALRAQATKKIPDRLPMTEAEKHFGCRFSDTTPNGECP